MTEPEPEPEHPYRWLVYLGVRSSEVTAEQLVALLGVTGARTSSVAGRRWPHLWQLDSGLAPDADLDEHLEALVRRCHGLSGQIKTLVSRPDCRVAVHAVLTFAPRGEDGSLPAMWLPPGVVRFAADCGIGIDVDGYLSGPVGPDAP